MRRKPPFTQFRSKAPAAPDTPRLDDAAARPAGGMGAPLAGGLVAGLILTILLAPQPARAGIVGDTLQSLAETISTWEQSVGTWLGDIAGRVGPPDRDEAAADAIRRMAVERPDRLAAMAEAVGFALVSYSIDQDQQDDLRLTFAYRRPVDSDTRRTLWRDVLQVQDTPARPELELTRALLDASDWRDLRPAAGFTVSAVEVTVDGRLRTRMVFEPAGK